jgi:heme exporter protein D
MAAGDTCGIIFGDQAGDGVTIPISFNLNVAPPQTAPVAATSSTVAATATTVKPASKATTTKAATSALAFTGTGPGLWWLALVGMGLIVLGLLALALVDQPRRMLRLVRDRASRHGPGSP